MSVYSMYYGGLNESKNFGAFGSRISLINEYQCLKEMLEATPHTLMFIITIEQWPSWMEKVKEYDLERFEIFRMPSFVTNPNSIPLGRRLRLVILKGTGSDES